MKILEYTSLRSTNSEATRIAPELAHGDIIVAREQTAGRGQRGNSWEAEPEKNLTFSLFLRPRDMLAADSFLLSMAVSVGIVDALNKILAPDEVKIKWPNDIYWNDLKLAGILIENSFSGQWIDHSIVGIGLNVNQTYFISDAPNPVSMIQIAGLSFDLIEVLKTVCESILKYIDHIPPVNLLSQAYHKSLWRREGIHLWREPDDKPFKAYIEEVAPSGLLTLIRPDGYKKVYAFKEVFPIL